MQEVSILDVSEAFLNTLPDDADVYEERFKFLMSLELEPDDILDIDGFLSY